jgi:hypothetical protein
LVGFLLELGNASESGANKIDIVATAQAAQNSTPSLANSMHFMQSIPFVILVIGLTSLDDAVVTMIPLVYPKI